MAGNGGWFTRCFGQSTTDVTRRRSGMLLRGWTLFALSLRHLCIYLDALNFDACIRRGWSLFGTGLEHSLKVPQPLEVAISDELLLASN